MAGMSLARWHAWPGIKYHTVARDLWQMTLPGMPLMTWRQMPIGSML
jgi:hypothetical protein